MIGKSPASRISAMLGWPPRCVTVIGLRFAASTDTVIAEMDRRGKGIQATLVTPAKDELGDALPQRAQERGG